MLFISAKEKTNISSLTTKLTDAINLSEAKRKTSSSPMRVSLENVLTSLSKKLSGDVVAPDIRNALYHLRLITGEVTNDLLLANILGSLYWKNK